MTPMPESPWQRLSYWGLLHFLVQGCKFSLQQYVFWVPTLLLLRDTWRQQPWLLPVLLAALLLLLFGIGWLQFRRYRFRLQQGRVQLHYGLLKRVQLDLPFDRIQNVVLQQPWYFRLSQQYRVGFDTAGSDDQEVALLALPQASAESLRQQVLLHQASRRAVDGPLAVDDADATLAPTPWLTLSSQALLFYGLLTQRAWVVLLLLLPFLSSIDDWFFLYLDQVMAADEDYVQSLQLSLAQLSWAMTLLIVVLPMTALVLLMSWLSALHAWLRWYGLRFGQEGDDYQLRYGSLSRRQVSLPRTRLVYLSWQQGLLQRCFGQAQLSLLQISVGYGDKNLLLPALTLAQAQDISRRLYPSHRLPQQWLTISKRALLLPLIWALLLPGLLGLALFAFHGLVGIGLMLVLWPAALGLAVLRWRRWGYASDEHFLYLRTGVFGWHYRVIPWPSIQAQAWTTTWFQRRHGLGSLYWQSAAGGLTLPFVPRIVAQQLFHHSLAQTRQVAQSWY